MAPPRAAGMARAAAGVLGQVAAAAMAARWTLGSLSRTLGVLGRIMSDGFIYDPSDCRADEAFCSYIYYLVHATPEGRLPGQRALWSVRVVRASPEPAAIIQQHLALRWEHPWSPSPSWRAYSVCKASCMMS